MISIDINSQLSDSDRITWLSGADDHVDSVHANAEIGHCIGLSELIPSSSAGGLNLVDLDTLPSMLVS